MDSSASAAVDPSSYPEDVRCIDATFRLVDPDLSNPYPSPSPNPKPNPNPSPDPDPNANSNPNQVNPDVCPEVDAVSTAPIAKVPFTLNLALILTLI